MWARGEPARVMKGDNVRAKNDYRWEQMIVRDGVRRDTAEDRGNRRESMAGIHFHDDDGSPELVGLLMTLHI